MATVEMHQGLCGHHALHAALKEITHMYTSPYVGTLGLLRWAVVQPVIHKLWEGNTAFIFGNTMLFSFPLLLNFDFPSLIGHL